MFMSLNSPYDSFTRPTVTTCLPKDESSPQLLLTTRAFVFRRHHPYRKDRGKSSKFLYIMDYCLVYVLAVALPFQRAMSLRCEHAL